ncbi:MULTISPECIES: acetyltransferase [Flavobacterium]|uniref:Sugar O-acyltransferase n=1 Tax=Flavobacterium faecale TaxID=1355330 RepID=A0A2S1LH02_9FLAO|nr:MULTISPECIES: acetyltransferase [Flavobacterium]AWG23055.1 sugar O-acyltransferase [Flavobacterium faecale]MCW2120290.1 acetyltransferase EpsM [Flavobacterium sp. 7A]
MKNIIIIGCGSHASELVDYIEYINNHSTTKQFNIKGMIDNTNTHYLHYNYNYTFLGNIDDHLVDFDVYYLLGIGNVSIRNKVLEEFKSKNAKFTGIIHPTALISKSAEIGEGTIISHNVSVGPKAKIGSFNVINSRCTIGHDTRIGDSNFLSPQVVLGGYAKIGNSNFLGTNSCLLPEIEIENNNKIMAGMTITSKVNNDETVFFRYKEKLIIRQ